MRILVIHNQLWAHYKSKLFSEINICLKEKYPESEFLVAHIALYEASRSGMQDENFKYIYPYKILFNRSLNEVSFKERLFSLFKTFDEFKPTVLNVTGYFDWAQILLMIYARQKGVKIVMSSESSSMDNNRSKIKENIKSWIVNRADTFFCFGKTSADYLISLGVKSAQIAVNNAAVIDEEVIKSNYNEAKLKLRTVPELKSENRNFVFVGRLAPEKNLELLVKAFIQIQKEIPEAQNWGLYFVGNGPSLPDLEALVKESLFPQQIRFTGGLPWYKVPEWLAKSDVLVLPSLSEPWGLVVNEAMVCGMPVIVSKICGCTDDLLNDGTNGFIFDPNQQQDLETALKFFIQNPEKIETMGLESTKLIKRFSSKKVALEMADSYKRL